MNLLSICFVLIACQHVESVTRFTQLVADTAIQNVLTDGDSAAYIEDTNNVLPGTPAYLLALPTTRFIVDRTLCVANNYDNEASTDDACGDCLQDATAQQCHASMSQFCAAADNACNNYCTACSAFFNVAYDVNLQTPGCRTLLEQTCVVMDMFNFRTHHHRRHHHHHRMRTMEAEESEPTAEHNPRNLLSFSKRPHRHHRHHHLHSHSATHLARFETVGVAPDTLTSRADVVYARSADAILVSGAQGNAAAVNGLYKKTINGAAGTFFNAAGTLKIRSTNAGNNAPWEIVTANNGAQCLSNANSLTGTLAAGSWDCAQLAGDVTQLKSREEEAMVVAGMNNVVARRGELVLAVAKFKWATTRNAQPLIVQIDAEQAAANGLVNEVNALIQNQNNWADPAGGANDYIQAIQTAKTNLDQAITTAEQQQVAFCLPKTKLCNKVWFDAHATESTKGYTFTAATNNQFPYQFIVDGVPTKSDGTAIVANGGSFQVWQETSKTAFSYIPAANNAAFVAKTVFLFSQAVVGTQGAIFKKLQLRKTVNPFQLSDPFMATSNNNYNYFVVVKVGGSFFLKQSAVINSATYGAVTQTNYNLFGGNGLGINNLAIPQNLDFVGVQAYHHTGNALNVFTFETFNPKGDACLSIDDLNTFITNQVVNNANGWKGQWASVTSFLTQCFAPNTGHVDNVRQTIQPLFNGGGTLQANSAFWDIVKVCNDYSVAHLADAMFVVREIEILLNEYMPETTTFLAEPANNLKTNKVLTAFLLRAYYNAALHTGTAQKGGAVASMFGNCFILFQAGDMPTAAMNHGTLFDSVSTVDARVPVCVTGEYPWNVYKASMYDTSSHAPLFVAYRVNGQQVEDRIKFPNDNIPKLPGARPFTHIYGAADAEPGFVVNGGWSNGHLAPAGAFNMLAGKQGSCSFVNDMASRSLTDSAAWSHREHAIQSYAHQLPRNVAVIVGGLNYADQSAGIGDFKVLNVFVPASYWQLMYDDTGPKQIAAQCLNIDPPAAKQAVLANGLAVLNNVATVTIADHKGFPVGHTVIMEGTSLGTNNDPNARPLNGAFTITASDQNTFSFAIANVANGADGSAVIKATWRHCKYLNMNDIEAAAFFDPMPSAANHNAAQGVGGTTSVDALYLNIVDGANAGEIPAAERFKTDTADW